MYFKKMETSLTLATSVTKDININLTPEHREVLKWHFIMGYIGFKHIQWLACTDSLKFQVNVKAVANFSIPK